MTVTDEPARAALRRPEQYDVVVVGARVAGAATAMLLARAGWRVLMIDRAPGSADTTSTHTLLRSGVLQLRRWGLLDEVMDSGTPPVRGVTLGFGDELVPIDLSESYGVDALYAPRRTVLDPLLVSAAQRAGVDYLDRCRARSVISDRSGRVVGLTIESDGQEMKIETRFVVGADGAHSRIARWVGAGTYRFHRPTNAVYYAYYDGIDTDGVYFQFTPGVTAGLIPTNDDRVCVYGGWPVGQHAGYRSDPEGFFTSKVLSAHPKFAEALGQARRVSPLRGTPGLPSFLRTPAGAGWALVGDAGYTKDPVSAHGMSDALRDAELCAAAIDSSLEDPLCGTEAAGHYRRLRDRLSSPLLDKTVELASYTWNADRASELMRGLSRDVANECEAITLGSGVTMAAVSSGRA